MGHMTSVRATCSKEHVEGSDRENSQDAERNLLRETKKILLFPVT